MKERWRYVRNYRGRYAVSNFGRVRSLTRVIICQNKTKHIIKGKILNLRSNKHSKHLNVTLSKRDVKKSYQVHRLVLEAFVGPCPPGMQCRHFPDRDPTNNNLDNLQWGTPSQNQRDRKLQGTASSGEKHGRHKTTWNEVNKIRRMEKSGLYTQSQIAKKFHLSTNQVSKIITGKAWKKSPFTCSGDRK